MSALRQIKPLPLAQMKPATLGTLPEIRWVDPTTLHVEENYQRNLSAASMRHIRKIVVEWDWAKFKTPTCVETEDGRLVLTDGQHTAIAAASHGGIHKIPVIVSTADGLARRAAAFISHNSNNLRLTPAQIFYGQIAAGDAVAGAVFKGCQKSGCVVTRVQRPAGAWEVGETFAVSALRNVATNKGWAAVARVTGILKAAGRAPVAAHEIKAVYAIIYAAGGSPISDDDLVTIIRSRTAIRWKASAAVLMAEGKEQQTHKAIAALWLSKAKRVNGSASAH